MKKQGNCLDLKYRSRFPYFVLLFTWIGITLIFYSISFPEFDKSFIVPLGTCYIFIFVISWIECYNKFYSDFLIVSFPTRLWYRRKIRIEYESIEKIEYFGRILGKGYPYILIKYKQKGRGKIEKYYTDDLFVSKLEKTISQINLKKILE